jgi:uncharacterized protein (DUF2237 family)
MAGMWESGCWGMDLMCGINSDMRTYYIPPHISTPERDAAIHAICAAVMVVLARTQRQAG